MESSIIVIETKTSLKGKKMSKIKNSSVTAKTVVKPIPVFLFDDDSMLDTGMKIKGSTPAEVYYVPNSIGNYAKRNNRFWDKPNQEWLVEKDCRVNGLYGTKYENALKKATGDDEAKAKEHAWAIHYQGSSVVMINKYDDKDNPKKFYFAFRPLRPDDIVIRWKDSKVELTQDELTELKSFKKISSKTPVVWRTIGISNIYKMTMGKIKYRRQSLR